MDPRIRRLPKLSLAGLAIVLLLAGLILPGLPNSPTKQNSNLCKATVDDSEHGIAAAAKEAQGSSKGLAVTGASVATEVKPASLSSPRYGFPGLVPVVRQGRLQEPSYTAVTLPSNRLVSLQGRRSTSPLNPIHPPARKSPQNHAQNIPVYSQARRSDGYGFTEAHWLSEVNFGGIAAGHLSASRFQEGAAVGRDLLTLLPAEIPLSEPEEQMLAVVLPSEPEKPSEPNLFLDGVVTPKWPDSPISMPDEEPGNFIEFSPLFAPEGVINGSTEDIVLLEGPAFQSNENHTQGIGLQDYLLPQTDTLVMLPSFHDIPHVSVPDPVTIGPLMIGALLFVIRRNRRT